MIPRVDMSARTEGAPVVMMMECIAMMPIPVMSPAAVYIPPTRVISPVPRRRPSVPVRSPEPVVYNGSIDINRLDDIVGTIDVLIAYHLNFHLILLVLLHVYRGNVLEYILSQDCLENDQTLIAFPCLYYAQIVHLSVAVQVQITERAVWVVEHRLELFQVLSLRKQLSYNLQIESFRDVRTVGGNCDCLVRPCHGAHKRQGHQKCS